MTTTAAEQKDEAAEYTIDLDRPEDATIEQLFGLRGAIMHTMLTLYGIDWSKEYTVGDFRAWMLRQEDKSNVQAAVEDMMILARLNAVINQRVTIQ